MNNSFTTEDILLSDDQDGMHSSELSCEQYNENQMPIQKHSSNSSILESFYRNNVRYSKWKWLGLTFCALQAFGTYYCFDIVKKAQDEIKDKITGEDDHSKSPKFDQLYAVPCYGSIILPFFGGWLIDTIGLKLCFISFAILLTIGQFITMVSSFFINHFATAFIFAMIGRLLLGIGKDTLDVCRFVFLSNWFIGQEFCFSYGINVSFLRLGNIIDEFITPPLADIHLSLAFGFGLLICVLVIICSIFLSKLDKFRKTMERQQFISKANYEEKFKCSDFKKIRIRFWVICLIVICLYASKNCFVYISTDFFKKRYGFEKNTDVMPVCCIVYIIPVIFSPIVGILIDRKGRRVTFLIVSSMMLVVSHTLFLSIPPKEDKIATLFGFFALFLISFSYTIFTICIWTIIPLVLKPNTIGTGFGIGTACSNVGYALTPIFQATLVNDESPNSYQGIVIACLVFALVATFLSIFLLTVDILYTRSHKSQIDRYNEYIKRIEQSDFNSL